MTDLALSIFIVGIATYFTLEVIDYLLSLLVVIRRNLLNLQLAPLLSAGGFYLLNMWGLKVIVASLASAFTASILERIMNRPTMIRQKRNYL